VLTYEGRNVVSKLRERQWLVEVMQPYWRWYTTLQLFEWHVGETRDEYDLDVRIQLTNLAACLNPIDSRWHAHIKNDDIKWLPVVGSPLRKVDSVIALTATWLDSNNSAASASSARISCVDSVSENASR